MHDLDLVRGDVAGSVALTDDTGGGEGGVEDLWSDDYVDLVTLA